MSLEVWTWKVEYPVKLKPTLSENIHRLAPGHIKTVQHEIPFTGYDGTGQSRDDRKGAFSFGVRVTRANYEGDEKFKEIFRFLMARKEGGNESFYWYNPAENLAGDPTGVSTVGRYLVKCIDAPEAVWTKLTLWDFANLTFEEVRS
jgi:hypothetical protein